MGRSPLLLLSLSLVGCAQIAGIDETSGPAPVDSATLALDRYSIGAMVLQEPLELAALSATYLVPDAADPTIFERVPADELIPGTWAADIKTGTPSVMFTLPDKPEPYFRIFQGVGRNLRSLFQIAEHANPTPPDPGSTIAVNLTLNDAWAVATDTLTFYVVGAWAERPFGADAPVDTATTHAVSIDYTTATSLNGQPLARISPDDVPLFLEYQGPNLVSSYEATGFSQTGADTIAGTMLTVARDQTIAAAPVAPMTVQTRFSQGRPSVGGFAMSWRITAAPGAAAGQMIGPRLTSGAIALADTQIDATYGNPFLATRGWESTFLIAASSTRGWTSPETLPLTLSASLTHVTPAGALSTELPAPLPIAVSIAANPLATDGLDVMLDLSKGVPVSVLTENRPADLYQIQLLEVVPNADVSALVTVPRLLVTMATKGDFIIPPELLVLDHRYVIRAMCIAGGYPALATGDLAMRQLPHSVSSYDSGVFTVKVTP